MLILLTMCIPMTSCSDDDDDEPAPATGTTEYTLSGTTWEYQESTIDEEGDETIDVQTLQFSENTVIWKRELIFRYSWGAVSTYPIHENKYTYTYSNDQKVAVLTPTSDNEKTNLAKLTADVTPGVKLVLWNASSNETIATFFAN